MNLNDYQQQAATTAIYPKGTQEAALTYTVLGLSSEAGELAGKWKKVIRDNAGYLNATAQQDMAAELGDVLWYVAMVADALDFDLEVIAEGNLAKLRNRANRGKLGGSGDNR